MCIFELIEAGDARGARKLLADDASLASARDDRGLSALMRASYRGGDVYAAVREAEPELDAWDRIVVGEAANLPAADAWSPDGFTPLHIAAFAKNAAAAQALVDAGADVNAFATASFARVTPLGTCAFVGATEVARVLLRAGADPTLTEIEGGSPLEAAMHNGHRDLVSLLVVLTAHGYAEAIPTARDSTSSQRRCSRWSTWFARHSKRGRTCATRSARTAFPFARTRRAQSQSCSSRRPERKELRRATSARPHASRRSRARPLPSRR